MAKANKSQISNETVATADSIAKATQRPGQSKEQTKLISAGIQKGIEQYKKQHKAKMREADKQRKKQSKMAVSVPHEPQTTSLESPQRQWLPWALLGLSWLGFIGYIYVNAS